MSNLTASETTAMVEMTEAGEMTTPTVTELMDEGINWPGLAGVIVFYLAILAVGIYAAWKSKTLTASKKSEDLVLAGRDIGLAVGMFTMTATWVGGGYINGTAEYIYTEGYGLVWTQAPIGYALSLVIGGLLFARKMREKKYVTMLDPFERKYGDVMAALLCIPALCGEIFWSAAILSALGASLAVILSIDITIAVVISAVIAVCYTFIGGLYSVAYTDVIQLICIFFGLWLGVIFAFLNDAVGDIGDTKGEWIGTFPTDNALMLWIDSGLLLMFGGMPWQVYFQRVLASKSAGRAQALSFLAAFGCIVMAVPALLIGAIARTANWADTDYVKYREYPIPTQDNGLILPLVLQYLTPTWVSVIGLGAVSAAVMSSADSSVLSAATMFSRNIYKPIREGITKMFNQNDGGSRELVGNRELIWSMRISVFVIGAIAVVVGLTVQSIYGLWYLSSDLVYVILFPQLLCVVYVPFSNTYGSVAAYIVGWLFRLLGGEPLIGLPAAIKYPYYLESDGLQLFPFKTLTMLLSLFTLIVVSGIFHLMFTSCKVDKRFDIFNSYAEAPKNLREEVTEGKENPGFDKDIFEMKF